MTKKTPNYVSELQMRALCEKLNLEYAKEVEYGIWLFVQVDRIEL